MTTPENEAAPETGTEADAESGSGTVPPRMEMALGVVIRRRPGVTRWAQDSWEVVGLLPHAAPADWTELRRDGEVIDYHAATVPLVLKRAEAEAIHGALNGTPPSIWVYLRNESGQPGARPVIVSVSASMAKARDAVETGGDMAERVAMPPVLEAWVAAFVDAHYKEEPFVKRKRIPHGEGAGDGPQGPGDLRVHRRGDVFHVPGSGGKGPQGA